MCWPYGRYGFRRGTRPFAPSRRGRPGLGFGLVFLPLNLMAFGTLDPRYRAQGAGLYNLVRSLSGSIAISLATVIITRHEQVSHADLAAHITEQRLPLPALTFTQQLGLAPGRVFGLVDAELNRQATMVAYFDAFPLMFWMVIFASPLVLLLKIPRSKPGPSRRRLCSPPNEARSIRLPFVPK